jgi:hypothetical protein
MERDVLNDAVALVEDAEDRDTLRHWSHATFSVRGRSGLLRRWQGRVRFRLALAARGERKRDQ